MQDENQLLDERGLSKLRWRCRRGLLENDIYIERFFERYADTLTIREAGALGLLMDLSDYDLLDIHLARKTLEQVNPELVRDDVVEIVSKLREIR
ncbi:MAG: succinate dehydrogenase assembly factor 2 [Rhodoferax sp.]